MSTTYAEDFPAIFEKRQERKLKKKKEKSERNRAAEIMSGRTYQIMVSALEDLVSSKKGLLAAFRIWKEVVGIEISTASKEIDLPQSTVTDVLRPHTDDENSIYSRYMQMTDCVLDGICNVTVLKNITGNSFHKLRIS